MPPSSNPHTNKKIGRGLVVSSLGQRLKIISRAPSISETLLDCWISLRISTSDTFFQNPVDDLKFRKQPCQRFMYPINAFYNTCFTDSFHRRYPLALFQNPK